MKKSHTRSFTLSALAEEMLAKLKNDFEHETGISQTASSIVCAAIIRLEKTIREQKTIRM